MLFFRQLCMNIHNGNYQKSINGYQYFVPSKINIDYHFSSEIYNLCIKATEKLSELKAFSNFAPDVDFFIQMHISKEAIDSNKIEGTRTELGELYLDNALFSDEKKDEIEEVKNYVNALNFGIKRMQTLPISSRFLQECHKILMDGVRGKNKNPGEFRYSQNWIGGATIIDAHFVPPSHEHIGELMSDLENFLHYNDCPDIIKIAIAHYQFETIHPFLDGNGRIGRLLISLYLIDSGLLYKPVLYLSEFFEKNKSLYYTNLDSGRSDVGLQKWLKFFLVGVITTAQKNLSTLQKISQLKIQTDIKILELGKKSKNAKIIIDSLYSNPVINTKIIQDLINSPSKATANNLVKDLVELGILREITSFKRNRVFVFHQYLELFSAS